MQIEKYLNNFFRIFFFAIEAIFIKYFFTKWVNRQLTKLLSIQDLALRSYSAACKKYFFIISIINDVKKM